MDRVNFLAQADFLAKDQALRKMEKLRAPFSPFWYNELLTLNEKLSHLSGQKRYERSLQIVERMRPLNIAPDSMTYLFLLKSAGRAGLPAEAEKHLSSMVSEGGVLPTSLHFHALMKAWAKAGDKQNAERVLKQMKSDGFPPTTNSFNILIAACKHPADAAEIVERRMPEARLAADRRSYNAWLHVCVRARDFAAADQAWSALKASGLGPDNVTLQTLKPLRYCSDQLAQKIWGQISTMDLSSRTTNQPKRASYAANQPNTVTERARQVEELESSANRGTSGAEASSSGTDLRWQKGAPMRLTSHPDLGQEFWLRFKEQRKVEPGPRWLLDLHGFSSEPEVRQIVYNKLEAMAEPGAERQGALTIFTGHHTRGGTQPASLRPSVKALLAYIGVPFNEGPSPGKLVVPSDAIQRYMKTKERVRLKQRVLRGATARYVGLGAALFASISLAPVLLARYSQD